jgi:hypothetical protein
MPTAYDTWLDVSAEDDAADAREEERQEWIENRVEELVAVRLNDDDSCWGVLVDLSRDAKDSLMQDLGNFFARFNLADTDAAMADVANALHRYVRPYVEEGLKMEAESDAIEEWENMEKDRANNSPEGGE